MLANDRSLILVSQPENVKFGLENREIGKVIRDWGLTITNSKHFSPTGRCRGVPKEGFSKRYEIRLAVSLVPQTEILRAESLA
jgi:hypothetical protein